MEEGNEGRNRGVLVKQINYIRREKYLIFLPIDRRKEREGKEGEARRKRNIHDCMAMPRKQLLGLLKRAKYVRVCVCARGVHDTVSVVLVSSHSASSRVIHVKK